MENVVLKGSLVLPYLYIFKFFMYQLNGYKIHVASLASLTVHQVLLCQHLLLICSTDLYSIYVCCYVKLSFCLRILNKIDHFLVIQQGIHFLFYHFCFSLYLAFSSPSLVCNLQKRNRSANIRLIAFPVFLCILIRVLQDVINTELDKPENQCGCICTSMNRDGQCESRSCGLEYSSLDQSVACPIPSPPKWPPILQIPAPEYRVVRTNFLASMDLPNESYRKTGSCPAITFFTGSNQSLGQCNA